MRLVVNRPGPVSTTDHIRKLKHQFDADVSDAVTLRKGVVEAVQSGNRADVRVGFDVIPNIVALDHVALAVGAVVWLDKFQNSFIIIGSQSGLSPPTVLAFRLQRTSNQSISSGTTSAVTWQTAVYEEGISLFLPTTTLSLSPGLWQINAGTRWDSTGSSGGGDRLMWIEVGGTNRAEQRKVATFQAADTTSAAWFVPPNTTANLRLLVHQSSGGSLDLQSNNLTFLSAHRIGVELT